MKTTTSRAFRRKHINTYQYADFDNFEDYFLYLHLNDSVQWMHFLGAFLGIPFLPWAVYTLYHGNIWPFVFYTALFYGSGFSSHWLCEGKISRTTPDYGPSYFYVININFRLLTGQLKKYENAYLQKYPHTLWVYDKSYAPPPCIDTRNTESEPRFELPESSLRPIQYPRWISAFFAAWLVLGFFGTLWGPTQFAGWGFLLQFLFLSLGFVCIYVAELENDLMDQAKREVGDWHKLIVALSLRRTFDLEQAETTTQLQQLNRQFWRTFLQIRRQIFRAGYTPSQRESALDALNQQGKAYLAHVSTQLSQNTLRCGETESAFLEQLEQLSPFKSPSPSGSSAESRHETSVPAESA